MPFDSNTNESRAAGTFVLRSAMIRIAWIPCGFGAATTGLGQHNLQPTGTAEGPAMPSGKARSRHWTYGSGLCACWLS
jgi:hypothetical protein